MSGHTPSEPVAWRFRFEDERRWELCRSRHSWFDDKDVVFEPLYSHAANEAKIEALVTALKFARMDLCRVAVDEDDFAETLADIDAALTSAGEK